MKIDIVIIDDEQKIKDDSLVLELRTKFGKENIYFFLDPDKGVQFIKDNLTRNMIVLLDINFPQNKKSGHEFLDEIAKTSQLIPVILWSAVNEDQETFSDFINNHAFGYMSKTVGTKEAMKIIDKAVLRLKYNLDNIIEDWILRRPEKDRNKLYITTRSGEEYTLNHILEEIRKQSDFGKKMEEKMIKLTIDLLTRQKRKIDD